MSGGYGQASRQHRRVAHSSPSVEVTLAAARRPGIQIIMAGRLSSPAILAAFSGSTSVFRSPLHGVTARSDKLMARARRIFTYIGKFSV